MNIGMKQNDIREIIDADKAHLWHHLIQHKPFETIDPRVMVEGRGMRVWDATGKEYLDAVSGGVWTVNVGYGRESIANAVRDQLIKMNYFAGSAGSIPGSQFAQKLMEKMPGMSRVYYANSGSEANEKVFKMVRQISYRHHGGKKSKILYRDRDYHGMTIATLSAGGLEPKNARRWPTTKPCMPKCSLKRVNPGKKRAKEALIKGSARARRCPRMIPSNPGLRANNQNRP